MSDTDGKKTLGLRGRGPGSVKQSFSHGRTKNVVVETKRKRVVVPKPGVQGISPSPAKAAATGSDPRKLPQGVTEAEQQRRIKALAAAKAVEAEEAVKREQDERERAEERERRRSEIEAKEREEAAAKKAEAAKAAL